MVVLTGATRGIGQAAAIELAKRGADLALVGRDSTRVDEVVDKARAAGQAGIAVSGQVADLAEMDEVRRLAAELETAYPRIDVLANNAGAKFDSKHTTTDGFEQTFALNHLAPFLLTNLLLDRLIASSPARVITISSGAQAMGRMNFDDLQGANGYSGQRAYNQSKLANVMFTYELARRLEGTGVTATVVHPGVVRTAFAAEDPSPVWRVLIPLMRPLMKSPAKGAQTPIYLASTSEVDGVSGKYYANLRPRRTNKVSYDDATNARLWKVSAELTGTA